MSVTYVYRIPLFHAYEYSLVYEGSPRPDDLDQDGLLHQILTYDPAARLVKAEQCVNGAITIEKNFHYADGRLTREEEIYHETGTSSEVIYRYRDGEYSKDYVTDGVLDAREVYKLDENGKERSYHKYDARDNLVEYRERNEHGDLVRSEENGMETRHEYAYRPDGKPDWKKTFEREGETKAEFLYTADGMLKETIIRKADSEIREVCVYEGSTLVKTDLFENGVPAGYTVYLREKNGAVSRTETYRRDELVDEYVEETDPAGRYVVQHRKGRVPLTNHEGRVVRMMPVAAKVEVLRDEDGRITDVLACDRAFQDQALGLECESNSYYFLEYEE